MSESQPNDIRDRDQFEVGDRVEVLCDHNRDDVRVRDWLD